MRWQGTAPEFHSRLKPEEFPTVAALHARWMEEDALLMAFGARLTDESRTLISNTLTPKAGGTNAWCGRPWRIS